MAGRPFQDEEPDDIPETWEDETGDPPEIPTEEMQLEAATLRNRIYIQHFGGERVRERHLTEYSRLHNPAGPQFAKIIWHNAEQAALEYNNADDAAAAMKAFASVDISDLALRDFQRDLIPGKPAPQLHIPDTIRMRYGLGSDEKLPRIYQHPPVSPTYATWYNRTITPLEEPTIFGARPVRENKECEEFQGELSGYQERLEEILSEYYRRHGVTYEEVYPIEQRTREGYSTDQRRTGIKGWGMGPCGDRNNSKMRPGAVFVATCYADLNKRQNQLADRKPWDESYVTQTTLGRALVNCKDRHFVCIKVFKSHCVAVPIFTYGGKGFILRPTAAHLDNTWATQIPIRDFHQLRSGTAKTQSYSRFGNTVLVCQRHYTDSNGQRTNQKFLTMSDTAVVNFAQLHTIRRQSRAIVFGELTRSSFRLLMSNLNKSLMNEAWQDRTLGQAPDGISYEGVDPFPYNNNCNLIGDGIIPESTNLPVAPGTPPQSPGTSPAPDSPPNPDTPTSSGNNTQSTGAQGSSTSPQAPTQGNAPPLTQQPATQGNAPTATQQPATQGAARPPWLAAATAPMFQHSMAHGGAPLPFHATTLSMRRSGGGSGSRTSGGGGTTTQGTGQGTGGAAGIWGGAGARGTARDMGSNWRK